MTPSSVDNDQWAVICAIHQEPDYVFSAEELRLARRMATLGLLREQEGQRFVVTPEGETAYLVVRR